MAQFIDPSNLTGQGNAHIVFIIQPIPDVKQVRVTFEPYQVDDPTAITYGKVTWIPNLAKSSQDKLMLEGLKDFVGKQEIELTVKNTEGPINPRDYTVSIASDSSKFNFLRTGKDSSSLAELLGSEQVIPQGVASAPIRLQLASMQDPSLGAIQLTITVWKDSQNLTTKQVTWMPATINLKLQVPNKSLSLQDKTISFQVTNLSAEATESTQLKLRLTRKKGQATIIGATSTNPGIYELELPAIEAGKTLTGTAQIAPAKVLYSV